MTEERGTVVADVRVAKIVSVLMQRRDLLAQVAKYLMTDGLEEEDTFELAESVCVVAFGERIECPSCGSFVFPGFTCWGCGDWIAPTTPSGEKEEVR